MELSKEMAEQYLLQMCQIRAFEEQAEKSYMAGKIHGTMHLSIGQEAAAVGSVAALNPDDFILSTHRGHGHCIAKGADLNLMMAEFYGKANGYCRGRGGSDIISRHVCFQSRAVDARENRAAGGLSSGRNRPAGYAGRPPPALRSRWRRKCGNAAKDQMPHPAPPPHPPIPADR